MPSMPNLCQITNDCLPSPPPPPTNSTSTPVDFSVITNSADFSTAVDSVGLVGINILIVYIALKGYKMIIRAIDG